MASNDILVRLLITPGTISIGACRVLSAALLTIRPDGRESQSDIKHIDHIWVYDTILGGL